MSWFKTCQNATFKSNLLINHPNPLTSEHCSEHDLSGHMIICMPWAYCYCRLVPVGQRRSGIECLVPVSLVDSMINKADWDILGQ